ncbi:MAG: universal stress protein [Desulfobacteraceae bacterium]|nr:universal stress protein [Desulfobacteraceae bacterium]
MKILVPVDGSDYSTEALKVAIECAKAKATRIHVISVVQSIGGMDDHEISPARRDRHEEILRARAVEAVNAACDLLGKANVVVASQSTISSVSIPEAIIEFAETEEIDLIIIGSRGLSQSSRFKIGSIANQVVRYSPCSVYLVKKPPLTN